MYGVMSFADLIAVASTVMILQYNAQSIPVNFVGHDRENLLFIAFFYWIFTFTLSRRSMKVEKRLGLGER